VVARYAIAVVLVVGIAVAVAVIDDQPTQGPAPRSIG
jgi:hypothetical protein